MDDTHEPLATISSRNYPRSLIPMMLDIQNYQTLREKSFDYIEKLDCLIVKQERRRVYRKIPMRINAHEKRRQRTYKQKGRLGRRRVNGFSDTNYVAVSYTSKRCPDLDPTVGGYLVESRSRYKGQRERVSKVSNCTLDRVAKYLRHVGLKLFWIDQESIDQQNHKKKWLLCKSLTWFTATARVLLHYSQHLFGLARI